MNDKRPTLTTRQGHPVSDNQSLRLVGERGPATVEKYPSIEKITHFDRELIPERAVHANTYKLVNDQRVAHLVKFHWEPRQGLRNLIAAQAAAIQAHDVGHATKDLYEASSAATTPRKFC